MVSPADQRETVSILTTEAAFSVSRACTVAGMPRSTYTYKAKPKDDAYLQAALEALTPKTPRHRLLVLPSPAKKPR